MGGLPGTVARPHLGRRFVGAGGAPRALPGARRAEENRERPVSRSEECKWHEAWQKGYETAAAGPTVTAPPAMKMRRPSE